MLNRDEEILVRSMLFANSVSDFCEAERAVAELMMRKADALTAAVVTYRATAAEFVEPARARAHERALGQGIKLKSCGRKPTRVRLLGGTELRIETLRMQPLAPRRPGRKRGRGRRGKGGAGVYPALAEMGVHGWSTPALRLEVAREVASANSVSVARESLRARGLDIKHETALRLTYLVADVALALRDHEMENLPDASLAPTSGDLAGAHVVASIDGGRLRVREKKKGGRRNAKGHQKFDAQWREPKVLTVYVVDENGRRDKRSRVLLDGTLGDADAAVALLVGHLRLMGAQEAAHLTLVADGAAWIWNRAETIREAVGLEPSKFTQVVDFFHASERLREVARVPQGWTEAEQARWYKKTRSSLEAGDIDQVLREIRRLKVGRRSPAIAEKERYFVNHASRMHYATFRERGCPVGSGAVESAVRRVVNLRLKGNSIFWLETHAEGVLHLRAYLKAERWAELVDRVLGTPVWPVPARAAA